MAEACMLELRSNRSRKCCAIQHHQSPVSKVDPHSHLGLSFLRLSVWTFEVVLTPCGPRRHIKRETWPPSRSKPVAADSRPLSKSISSSVKIRSGRFLSSALTESRDPRGTELSLPRTPTNRNPLRTSSLCDSTRPLPDRAHGERRQA